MRTFRCSAHQIVEHTCLGVLNEKLPGWLRAFPARWVVRGENNRRGYVRRSCSVGLMDGGSIPPGYTISFLLRCGGRSGERRVGERGRSRWAADYLKKKRKECRGD